MSEPSPDTERAARAQEALNNPLLREAFGLLKDNYIAGIRACEPKDDMGRYRYTVALNTLDAVERHLKAVVDTGLLDAAQTNDLSTPSRRWIPRF
jgi:hypothetical protein